MDLHGLLYSTRYMWEELLLRLLSGWFLMLSSKWIQCETRVILSWGSHLNKWHSSAYCWHNQQSATLPDFGPALLLHPIWSRPDCCSSKWTCLYLPSVAEFRLKSTRLQWGVVNVEELLVCVNPPCIGPNTILKVQLRSGHTRGCHWDVHLCILLKIFGCRICCSDCDWLLFP